MSLHYNATDCIQDLVGYLAAANLPEHEFSEAWTGLGIVAKALFHRKLRSLAEANAAEAQASVSVSPDPDAHEMAVTLGRQGGLKGGPARAAKLSAVRRSEIAQKAANIRWTKEGVPCDLCDAPPYQTLEQLADHRLEEHGIASA